MKIKVIVFSFIICILTTPVIHAQTIPPPKINNGFIDLSSYNFEEQGKINLNGYWEFYPFKFIQPGHFEGRKCDYIPVPGKWTSSYEHSKKMGKRGYGTYRLRMKFAPEQDSVYTLQLPYIMSCYKLWVNNQLLQEVGKIGTSKQYEEPRWFVTDASFKPKAGENEIIIQVSNFHHRKNGIVSSVKLGTAKQMKFIQWKNTALTSFVLGLTMIMAMYYLGLFTLTPKNYSNLFLGLTALFTATHQFINSETMIVHFFPNIEWEFMTKIDYISNNLRIVALFIFFYFSFKEEINKSFIKAIVYYGIIITTLVISTKAYIYSHTLIIFEIIFSLSIVYIVYVLIQAIKNKRDGALYSFIGTIILIIAGVNDILHEEVIIQTAFLSPLGLFIFIFFQSHMLTLRSVHAFKRNKELSNRLNYVNKNLEQLVSQRTAEVEEKNTELVVKSENLLKTNHELKIQKKNIVVKNEELRKKGTELRVINEQLEFKQEEILHKNEALHQRNAEIVAQRNELEHRERMLSKQKERLENSQRIITDSILYAKQIQSAILPEKTLFTNYFKEHFILFKPRDIVSGDFYYITKKGKYLIFAAVDCTGHGVPGGFMSMLGITFLNEITQRKYLSSTGEILDELNLYVQKSLKQKRTGKMRINDGMDLALCKLNLETNHLQYSGAFNPLYIIRPHAKKPDEFIEIKADRMPIGFHKKEPEHFTTHNLVVYEDDMIYMFSDGFSDQFGGINEQKYMIRNFKSKLYEIHKLPAKEQKKELNREFLSWKSKLEQIDDILVMGLKIDYVKHLFCV